MKLWFPSAVLAAALYSHPTMLNGEFVYDDGGTVTGNPVTQAQLPFSEVWRKDYWGYDDIASESSHKSFRPLTTITFRLNYLHSIYMFGELKSVGFHTFNVIIHTIITLLIFPTVHFAFGRGKNDTLASIAALLFAAHPIHSEAVQNITGRAELLMALFFLLGFLSYAVLVMEEARKPKQSSISFRSALAVLLASAFTLCSLLSKEMGATLPMLCAVWDFFVACDLSFPDIRFLILGKGSSEGQARDRIRGWASRTAFLAFFGIGIMVWRLSINGGTTAYFRYNSNRATIEPIRLVNGQPIYQENEIVGGDQGVHGVYRLASIAWIWFHYLSVTVFPKTLCPDWSGPSVPLIRGTEDPRFWIVLAFLITTAALILRFVLHPHPARKTLMAIAFYFFPFFLSMNLFVVTGTTVAERVMYLPSLGVCMAFAILLESNFLPLGFLGKRRWSCWGIVVLVLLAFSQKCVERNFAWTNQVELWKAAYDVNPDSAHVCQNYGVNLSVNDQIDLAIQVLQHARNLPAIDRIDSEELYPTLAMCLKARGKLYEALEVVKESWEEFDMQSEALHRGVKIWYMHELEPTVKTLPLKRARLLAVQASILGFVDKKEASKAALSAVALASNDAVVQRLVTDLQNDITSIASSSR